MGTSSGLSRLDQATGELHNYTSLDGLPSNQCTLRAAARGRDGRLYFGTTDGLVAFDPEGIKRAADPVSVRLTSFDLFDKPVRPAVKGSPLQHSIEVTRSITLKRDQSVFSFRFAALDFSGAGISGQALSSVRRNRYRYRMDGFDTAWRYCPADERRATYTNLPPGQYLFNVDASNRDGTWSGSPVQVAIQILPSWHETFWFKAFFSVAFLGIVTVAYKWRTQTIRRRNDELNRQIRERSEHEKVLQASEGRFRMLYDDNPAIYLTVDAEGVVLMINRFGAESLGYPSEELAGRNIRSIVHVEDGALFRGHFDACLAGAGAIERWEHRFLCRDGKVIWVRQAGRLIVHPERPPVVLLACEDITERVKLQDELRQIQKVEAIGQLAGGVAHDFNNILTVIVGGTEMARLPDCTPEERLESLNEIKAAADRAASLTRQLLIFSRRQAINRVATDLNQVTAGITKLISRLISENIVLKVEPAAVALPILADTGMIEQVLVNLAVNARDAMPEGGTLRIRTRFDPCPPSKTNAKPPPSVDGWAVLEVIDTGKGIPPEIMPRIFEPFFTTKPAGNGTGLGLATCAGIVQQHEGCIEVESTIGMGTLFRVAFPIHSGALAGEEATGRESSQALRGKETILLVEDEPKVRQFISKILERHGYRVLEAGDGEQAMAIWSKMGPDIDMLMSDIIMPGRYNGRTLAERLLVERPGLCVGLMSGYDPDSFKLSPKLQTPLAKPVQTEDLLRFIRARLDDAARRAEA
jgi:PAS domain S-box-containing protein